MKTFKKNQIVYCQGRWKCKVIRDWGNGTISYRALEGFESSYKGQTLSASKSLFKATKSKLKIHGDKKDKKNIWGKCGQCGKKAIWVTNNMFDIRFYCNKHKNLAPENK